MIFIGITEENENASLWIWKKSTCRYTLYIYTWKIYEYILLTMILFAEVEIAIRFQVNITWKISDRIFNKLRYLLAPLHTNYISKIKKIGSTEIFSFYFGITIVIYCRQAYLIIIPSLYLIKFSGTQHINIMIFR